MPIDDEERCSEANDEEDVVAVHPALEWIAAKFPAHFPTPVLRGVIVYEHDAQTAQPRRMRVTVLVGVLVMLAMHHRPTRRRPSTS